MRLSLEFENTGLHLLTTNFYTKSIINRAYDRWNSPRDDNTKTSLDIKRKEKTFLPLHQACQIHLTPRAKLRTILIPRAIKKRELVISSMHMIKFVPSKYSHVKDILTQISKPIHKLILFYFFEKIHNIAFRQPNR